MRANYALHLRAPAFIEAAGRRGAVAECGMAIFHRSLQLFHFFDDHFRFLRYFGLPSPNKIHRPLALQAIYDDVLPRHRIPLRIFIIEKMA